MGLWPELELIQCYKVDYRSPVRLEDSASSLFISKLIARISEVFPPSGLENVCYFPALFLFSVLSNLLLLTMTPSIHF